jgi:hypothetical protein
LDETDLGLFNPGGASSARENVLVKSKTVYKLRVVDGPAHLLHDPNIPQVNVGRR